MPIPVTIPRLGWNMEEGVFVEWLKAHGEAVRAGDAVFRLEGEKATEDIESLDAGTLHVPPGGPKAGDKLAVGAVIGYLLRAGESAPSGDASAPSVVAQASSEQPSQEQPPRPSERPGLARPSVAVTPRARRLASRLGIDAAQLRGSGRNGRVCERDVAAGAVAKPQAAPPAPLAASRRVIAARMVESRQTTAPVTLTSVVDATNLVNLREQFKAAGGDPVPSYTDFLLKLTAAALQKHPLLASRWSDAGIVPPASIDIGLAVDTDAGLLVPVVRDVPALGLRAVAAKSRELIEHARKGELATRDMTGGCFTVTNLGVFGIDAFTPIINPPECAILGVGRIERRPVMDGDRVVGRELITLSLTFDHRIVDGAPAARFLQTLAACVHNPAPWVSS